MGQPGRRKADTNLRLMEACMCFKRQQLQKLEVSLTDTDLMQKKHLPIKFMRIFNHTR